MYPKSNSTAWQPHGCEVVCPVLQPPAAPPEREECPWSSNMAGQTWLAGKPVRNGGFDLIEKPLISMVHFPANHI